MKILFFNTGLGRSPFTFIFAVILGLSSVFTVQAQTTTFAQFFGGGGQDYVFTNNTSGAAFNTISGGAPILFVYQNITGLPPSLQGGQSAHLTITATNFTPASGVGTLTQPLDQTITISIIRDTPAPPGVGGGARTNLLTAVITTDSTSPNITGSGNSAGFSGSTPGHNVVFSSDFISFASTSERNAGLTFSSVTPTLSLGPGGFLNNFTAAGAGTFASDPAPTYAPPTAASVEIGGRILNQSNSGLRGAQVTLTEADGSQHTMTTGSFGRFRFSGIEIGQTVVISVSSGRYNFSQRIITLENNISDLDFYPDL